MENFAGGEFLSEKKSPSRALPKETNMGFSHSIEKSVDADG